MAAIKVARLKTIGAAGAIRREIQILQHLRHPGVVRLLDHGVSDGLPWYAMELVQGVTLEQHLEQSSRGQRTVPDVNSLTIMRRLASTIGHLHSVGVAHCDITPRNIILCAHQTPVLVDFGLAVRVVDAVEEVGTTPSRMGTAAYLAPERIRGSVSDSRPSDLYALGCVLFEMLAGAPPFAGEERQLLSAHVRSTPVLPAELASSVQPELIELVLQLLAKSPTQRARYTRDAAERLGAWGGLDWQETGPSRTQYLSRPALIGRDDIMRRVLEMVAEVRRGAGTKLLIVGPSGVGKSRIASELACIARAQGVTVVCGAATAQAGEPHVVPAPIPLAALRPLLQALAEHGRVGGLAASDQLLGSRIRILAAFEPEFESLPGFELEDELAPLPPEAAQQRLLDALFESCVRFAARAPLLLVLDDLQWADDLTQRFLRRLRLAALRGHALAVLGTLRDDGEANAESRDSFDGNELRIGPLEHEHVGRVIREMLAAGGAPQSLEAVVLQQAEGNPFFVAEYLRTALAEGLLWRDGLGDWQFPVEDPSWLPLPDGVRALIERRLSGLSPEARRLVECAAALGRECDASALRQLGAREGQQGPLHDDVMLQELVIKQVLEPTNGGRYRFLHDQLREVAYDEISGERRALVHGAVASAILRASQGRALTFREQAELGHHYTLGGDPQRGAVHLESAGEQALKNGATREARSLLQRALQCRTPLSLDDNRGWRLHGEACFALGDLGEARRSLACSLERSGVAIPKRTASWLVLLVEQAGIQLAHRLIPERLRDTPRDDGTLLAERSAAGESLAIVYYFTRDPLPLLAVLLLAVNCAERARPPRALAVSYARIGYIVGLLGLTRLAHRYFDRALVREALDAHSLGLALYLRAFHGLGRGEWQQAIDDGTRAMGLLSGVGDWQEQEVAATIVGHAYYYSGQLEAAESTFEAVLASATKRECAQHVAWALFLKARSWLARGETSAAIELLIEARRVLAALLDPLSLSVCEGLLVRALLQAGRASEAQAVCVGLEQRTSGPVLPLAPCLHAYQAVLEVALAEWTSAPSAALGRQHRARTQRACKDLARFARMFPMARPALLLWRSRLAQREGRTEVARQLLAESERGARCMRFHQLDRA